jgi:hypothetical protein
MHGVIGRVRLLSPRSALGTYREAGLVIMSAQSSACAGRTRTLVAEPSDAGLLQLSLRDQGHGG